MRQENKNIVIFGEEHEAINQIASLRKGLILDYNFRPHYIPGVTENLKQTELNREMTEILTNFPDLETQRAMVYFPREGHLATATDRWERHEELYQRTLQYLEDLARERNEPEPSIFTISGDSFSLRNQHYLRFDADISKTKEYWPNLRKLVAGGYCLLDYKCQSFIIPDS